jgi:hypothetical protein
MFRRALELVQRAARLEAPTRALGRTGGNAGHLLHACPMVCVIPLSRETAENRASSLDMGQRKCWVAFTYQRQESRVRELQ